MTKRRVFHDTAHELLVFRPSTSSLSRLPTTLLAKIEIEYLQGSRVWLIHFKATVFIDPLWVGKVSHETFCEIF